MAKHGSGGNEAELLFAKWLGSEGWTHHRAARAGFIRLPSGRALCQSHDVFGCLDFLAFCGNEVWGVQVTTKNGASPRRRKLEAISWPIEWRISVVTHEVRQGFENKQRSSHAWRVSDLVKSATGSIVTWMVEAIEFDKEAVEDHARKAKENAQISAFTEKARKEASGRTRREG